MNVLTRRKRLRVAGLGLLRVLLGVLLLAPLSMLGCSGYHYAQVYPEGFSTVAVPVFENQTFYRGVAYDVTEALIKEIETRTPYKVTDAARADTLLRGVVTAVEQQPLSRTRVGGLPQEVEVEITIDFEWVDQRRGGTLVSRRGFTSVGRYVPTQPIGEDFVRGRQAAAARTARDVVAEMRSPW
ncbi:MAG: LptE family protein [Algisphaera sp.]